MHVGYTGWKKRQWDENCGDQAVSISDAPHDPQSLHHMASPDASAKKKVMPIPTETRMVRNRVMPIPTETRMVRKWLKNGQTMVKKM